MAVSVTDYLTDARTCKWKRIKGTRFFFEGEKGHVPFILCPFLWWVFAMTKVISHWNCYWSCAMIELLQYSGLLEVVSMSIILPQQQLLLELIVISGDIGVPDSDDASIFFGPWTNARPRAGSRSVNLVGVITSSASPILGVSWSRRRSPNNKRLSDVGNAAGFIFAVGQACR